MLYRKGHLDTFHINRLVEVPWNQDFPKGMQSHGHYIWKNLILALKKFES